jgi:tetrahydromethanopterin S-methyltransferase subunit H
LTRLFLKSVSIPDSFRFDPFELVEAVEAGLFSRAAARESLLSSVSEAEDVASGTGEPVVVEGVEASEEAPEDAIGDKVSSGKVEAV